MKSCQLQNGLEKFLDTIPESLLISINTIGGDDLVSAKRSSVGPESSVLVSTLAPCFYNSLDQCTRLNLGAGNFTLTWINSHILAQVAIETVIISVLLSENANLGLLEERLSVLTKVLRPVYSELSLKSVI
mmetsp:Transcript_27655/g.27881  ORF Transcript_27655/g.27881 Transcript_27655/m.27881 type:complete len:131 (+) Transcript_27655:161-553(+)